MYGDTMDFRITSIICMILLVVTAGCASTTELAEDALINSELRFEEPEQPEPEPTPIYKTDWELVREHIINNYDISEEYFDKHFRFDRIESGAELRSDEFDPRSREFPVLTNDARLIKYHLVLTDEAGNEYIVREYLEGVYIFQDQVVDFNNDDLQIDVSKIPRRVYSEIGPTGELTVHVNKQEAIAQGKYIVDCTRKEWFDTWEARENLDLQFRNGKLVWAWESKGNACFINAMKPGEVEVLII